MIKTVNHQNNDYYVYVKSEINKPDDRMKTFLALFKLVFLCKVRHAKYKTPFQGLDPDTNPTHEDLFY